MKLRARVNFDRATVGDKALPQLRLLETEPWRHGRPGERPCFLGTGHSDWHGLSLLQKMIDKNLDTFGKLAFVCSCKPAIRDDTPLFKAVKEQV